MEKDEKENWHIVGVIRKDIALQIGMDDTTPVWISDTIVKHITDNHGAELAKRNTTAVSFVHKVIGNFNSVHRQKDGTVVLAIEGSRVAMVTYIMLELAKENYWRVRSAHIRPLSQLHRYTLLWKKESKILSSASVDRIYGLSFLVGNSTRTKNGRWRPPCFSP